MSRTHLVFRKGDFPGTPDKSTRQALDELFGNVEWMFGSDPETVIPGSASAFAIVARTPKLANKLIELSNYMLQEMEWTTRRKAIKQLAIQTLNLELNCHFSYQSHIVSAERDGLSVEQQTQIPFWETTNVFNDEQRMVIEYTLAVVRGDVPGELFARVVDQYGESEAIEFTVSIGWWALWAMLINATDTDYDFGFGTK